MRAVARAIATYLVASLAIAAPVFAEAPRAIILPTQLSAGTFAGKKTLPQELNLRLLDHLKRAGFLVMGPELLSLVEGKCRDESCMRQIAQNLGLDLVVRAELINIDRNAPSFRAEVAIFDKTHRRSENSCVGCSALEAAEMVARVLDDLLKKTEPVAVATSAALVIAQPPAPTRPRWWKPTFFTLGAVGAAAFVAGSIAVSLKAAQYGDPFCDANFPTDRTCPYGRDTRPAIIASATIAGVGLALSITGFVLASQKVKR